MKAKKSGISIFCRCEVCESYFDVTGRRRSIYCSRKCRDSVYYAGKAYIMAIGSNVAIKDRQKRKLSIEMKSVMLAEYSTGLYSSRDLGKKYGVNHTLICRYVRQSGMSFRKASGRPVGSFLNKG